MSVIFITDAMSDERLLNEQQRVERKMHSVHWDHFYKFVEIAGFYKERKHDRIIAGYDRALER